MTEGKFDLNLISEFNSSASGPLVVKWMEKAELVCKMCQMKHQVLLRFMGDAVLSEENFYMLLSQILLA